MKAFLCLLAGALSCVSGSATTLVITSALDNGPGSLRATVAAAASGDVIEFDPSLNGQVILLASQINVTRELTIDGPGADKITISGGNSTRILSATAPLTLSGLTLRSGLGSGGALLVSRARANIIGCIFADNAAPNGTGGAIYNPGSSLDLRGCTFSRNTASGFGLGAAFYGSRGIAVTMTDCVFAANSAHDGGAVFADGPLTLLRCTFTGNSIPTDGIAGAVFNEYQTLITGCIFSGNSAGDGGEGGALFIADGTIRDSLISGNAVGSTKGFEAQGDPLLGPLQDNGGPTATMALLTGSVAIDHGDPAFDPTTFVPPMVMDQRGAPRLIGDRLDTGAYEAEPAHFPRIDSLTAAQILECAGRNGTSATVELQVSDSKGHALVIQWIVDNQVRQTDHVPASKPATTGHSSYTGVFPDGTTEVLVVVNDGESAPVAQSTAVTIRDTTPPTIVNLSANPSVLSPPNHKMLSVTISITANDICDPSPKSKIIAVTSNEPGAGQYQITGDLTLNLQSDRNGRGNGRIYTIAVQATDASGNTAMKNVIVTVPKGNK